MQRFIAILAAAALMVLALTGCNTQAPKVYQDGTYTAEFAQYDSYGYKDFVKATVKGGAVIEVVYDGKDEAGMLKTEDTKYEADMKALQDTYPLKYSADLENQYMQTQDIDQVDALANATYSSDSFRALFTALEQRMQDGDTTLVVVENVPVK